MVVDHDVLVERADIARELRHHPVGDVAAAAAGDVADRLHLIGEREAGLRGRRCSPPRAWRRGRGSRAPPTPRGRGAASSGDGALSRPASIAASAQRHVPGRLAEVAPRRRVDAIGAGAEIDAVEVELEDLVLGKAELQPEREDHLLHLALEGALRREEQVLGELLGQRRAALHHAAGGEVDDRGAGRGRSGRCRNGTRSAGPRWRSPPAAGSPAFRRASASCRRRRRGW